MLIKKLKIGVLGIQGSIIEHVNALEKSDVETIIVREKQDLNKIHGLIIPGGESTTISKLLERFNLSEKIKKKVKDGMGIYGTCAGAILLSKRIIDNNGGVKNLNLMDITVCRNAYGSQIYSFVDNIDINELKLKMFPAIFIRAPKINEIGKNVKILAKYKNDIIFAQEENLMVSTFHPELGDKPDIHKYFIQLCKRS
ncbi:glutamine amidotransferase subunit PdxT [Candidatus Peregrinibacteria bacterium RIFOXYC2_FULL_33_13]|nr:MAG: Glutamine amidotransferase subunit PdxT [Candidatus Peregrinibacteria bacterium GW2011_GWA2_33_10]KKP41055.1 MAG: SNO glutamine amidotransferase, glutamine amidotransferase [Candidatus Peregrinibacteria bacterium GW2011_GWC2_33_13]OGJ52471.1 MAG: glutamine amidotransferase subunit PdxT [Candidatus Peregrinibacteria bacterium RIFOXYC2_FULL_33_13]